MQKTRLDIFLAKHHPYYSRTQIKKLIDDGFVLIDGQKRKPSFLLHGGERIEMIRRAPEIPKAEPEEIPLDIIYEDDEVLVINKAAGMVAHPAPGHYKGTLVSAVLHHLKNPATAPGIFRPGIVHRLDKGTTGVMVIAKTDLAQKHLAKQFKDRKVEKTYLTLVFGKFPQKKGTIVKAIGRDLNHRRKFSSHTRRAREAITHFAVTREFGVGAYVHTPLLSLVTVKLETGRTHQIRVHLSESHHPIVGDTVYGAKSFLSSIKDEKVRASLESLDRPLLHAWKLSFQHPKTGEKLSFEAPLPNDFQSALELIS